RDLRCEDDRGDGGGRGDRSVVADLGRAGAARGIAVKFAFAAVDRPLPVPGAVAGGEAPDVGAIIAVVVWIGDREGALRERGAARVLEIVDTVLAVHVVLDAAEVDPDVGILMAEQRREEDVVLTVERSPVIGLRIFAPGFGVDRMGRRA